MKQRKYMIFGITGGIGTSLGLKLKQQAHHVYGFGRDADRLQGVTSEACDGTQVVDMQDWQAVRSSIAKSKEEMDGLDGVAVCIGSLLLKPAHLTSQEEWNDVMHTHVSTAFGILGAAAHAMMRTGGSIVLTASAASRIGMANHEAIAAAKGAIMGLTLSAAATYATRGIRVNCVAPGLVETPLRRYYMNFNFGR
jgi:3-oxoacyl-[acyl-carrier protein] reductase